MIIDLAQSESVAQPHSSVCIVGAGAAGICLALELAKSGVDVTLLESGGLEQEAATQNLYTSEVSGMPHIGIHKGRFRVLGGSTTRWAGQILELDSHNFDVRPWVPDSGWPFPKQTLAPYHKHAIELEGLASAMSQDSAVWKAARCTPPDFGDQLVHFFSRWCPEPNFVRLHGQKLRESAKIIVYLHANLCDILLAEGHESIAGLGCRTLGGRSAIFTADRYVFCLGGIESARVLLQPVAQARVAPWNAHGLVGRYFQDHIDATLLEVKVRNKHQFHDWFDNVYRSSFKYFPYIKLSLQEQERLECLGISASFLYENAKTEAFDDFASAGGQLLRGKIRGGNLTRVMRSLPLVGFALRKAMRRGLQGRGYSATDGGAFLRFHSEQTPNPESRVELTSERDATGLFRTRLHWTVTDQDVHTMQQFARVVGEAFRSSDFADVLPHPALEAGGSELIKLFEDTNHHMGTTRMADSPQRGVVDANLRMFGVDNGYVCSSSVFPTSGFSNPTHTIIALAVRLAEHLAGSARDTQARASVMEHA